jgi:aspartate aminotransferase-like enzyme
MAPIDDLLLMTPGPTRVPERVLRAGARPMLHHRSAAFSQVLAEVLDLLPPLFGTREPALPVHATGRGAMEAVLCNLCSPGDAIGVCANGRFGELWGTLAESLGLTVHRVCTDWERDVDPEAVDRLLREHPPIRAVAMAYSDTSTGVANDVAAVARVARARDVLLLVDGVSSIGGMPFAFDEWGVDAAITASQKCLMSSPGLSFVVLNDRARAAIGAARLPRRYWDLAAVHGDVTKPKPETPGTPPVHIVMQIGEALKQIHSEGLSAVFARHAAMAELVGEQMRALGLAHQCPSLNRRATTLTAVAAPANWTPASIREGLSARGILVAGALEQYAPHAFRIGHMGDIRLTDVQRTMAALADVLRN